MKQIIKNRKAKILLIILKIFLRQPKKLKRFRNKLKRIVNKK
jgi:hypothetical protein